MIKIEMSNGMAPNAVIYVISIKYFRFFFIESHLFSVIRFILLFGQSILRNASKYESDWLDWNQML